jgi:hypothetical protein
MGRSGRCLKSWSRHAQMTREKKYLRIMTIGPNIIVVLRSEDSQCHDHGICLTQIFRQDFVSPDIHDLRSLAPQIYPLTAATQSIILRSPPLGRRLQIPSGLVPPYMSFVFHFMSNYRLGALRTGKMMLTPPTLLYFNILQYIPSKPP